MRLLDHAFPGSYASAQSAQRSETYRKVAIQLCFLFHVFYRASLFCTPIGFRSSRMVIPRESKRRSSDLPGHLGVPDGARHSSLMFIAAWLIIPKNHP